MRSVHTAYCPYCRTVTNLSVSITLPTIAGADWEAETVASRTYHCESCCSFVRSEEDEPLLTDYIDYSGAVIGGNNSCDGESA
jgi:hypothetical protein